MPYIHIEEGELEPEKPREALEQIIGTGTVYIIIRDHLDAKEHNLKKDGWIVSFVTAHPVYDKDGVEDGTAEIISLDPLVAAILELPIRKVERTGASGVYYESTSGDIRSELMEMLGGYLVYFTYDTL